MTANYVLLEKITVGASGASSVTFSGIPQTGYTDLVVKVSARTTRTGQIADNLLVQFNGSATGFTYRRLAGTGVGAGTNSFSSGYLTLATPASDATANTFGNAEVYIPNYTSANNKSVSIDSVGENNATSANMDLNALLWSNTAAITSIALVLTDTGTSFVPNSTFYLYGVAKLGTTPAIAPKATGGDIIDTDGTYWYHTFLSSGTFTPQVGLTCDYLVVAGGGGGGYSNNTRSGGGGGGAGGLRSTVTATGGGGSLETALSLGTSAYTVTIGAGGAGGIQSSNTVSTNGSNSVFSTITSTGGGRGANTFNNRTAAASGGSGGGGDGDGGANASGGSGTTNQGYAGGTGDPSSIYQTAGGGGGAGAVGGSATPTSYITGGGGNGVATSVSGSSVTYAGGGGGGNRATFSPGSGGTGGGGSGGNSGNGVAGTANRGGGGGGAGNNFPTYYDGGNGGSGIVIVRYAV